MLYVWLICRRSGSKTINNARILRQQCIYNSKTNDAVIVTPAYLEKLLASAKGDRCRGGAENMAPNQSSKHRLKWSSGWRNLQISRNRSPAIFKRMCESRRISCRDSICRIVLIDYDILLLCSKRRARMRGNNSVLRGRGEAGAMASINRRARHAAEPYIFMCYIWGAHQNQHQSSCICVNIFAFFWW